MDNKFILKEVIHTLFKHIFSPRSHGKTGTWLLANEKEMKMPMLFDTKEQAEKEAYKFVCEGAHQMGDKWMPCSMHKHNH